MAQGGFPTVLRTEHRQTIKKKKQVFGRFYAQKIYQMQIYSWNYYRQKMSYETFFSI